MHIVALVYYSVYLVFVATLESSAASPLSLSVLTRGYQFSVIARFVFNPFACSSSFLAFSSTGQSFFCCRLEFLISYLAIAGLYTGDVATNCAFLSYICIPYTDCIQGK